MKSVKTHIVTSTVLCALTLAVTLAARGALPEQVPMQWGLTGEASSFWRRGVRRARRLRRDQPPRFGEARGQGRGARRHVLHSARRRARRLCRHRVPGDEVMAMSDLGSARALRPLLSLQARSLLYGLGVRRGRGRARLLSAAALAVLLAAVAVGYLWALGSGMVAAGAAGAIPALAALAGSLAAVALVFVKAPGTVFGCRDYDLMAALPVPVRTVVLARTAPLYGFGVALSALLSAPLYAAYFISVPASPTAVAAAAAASVLAPLAPAAVAMLASLALTSVAVRFRCAGVVQLALSALLVTAVVAGSLALGRASSGVDDAVALVAMGDMAGALSAAAASVYPPAALAAAAVREGSLAGLLAFAALSLALPVLVTLASRHATPR